MQRFLRYWLPVLIWLGVMFVGSTGLLSAEQTSRVFVPLLRWLKPDISAEALAEIHFVVRKLGHIFEYALLAVLLWRAMRGGTNLRIRMACVFAGVWLTAGVVAVTDEFQQAFVPSRAA